MTAMHKSLISLFLIPFLFLSACGDDDGSDDSEGGDDADDDANDDVNDVADQAALEHYHDVFAALAQRNMTPLATLHHYTLPR